MNKTAQIIALALLFELGVFPSSRTLLIKTFSVDAQVHWNWDGAIHFTNVSGMVDAICWFKVRADWEWLDLIGTNLIGADLRGADLRGADLTWAKLRGADLRGADLRGADLRGADLTWADLRGADLTGTHLNGAIINETIGLRDLK